MPQPGDVLCYGETGPLNFDGKIMQLHIWLPLEIKSREEMRRGKDKLTARQKARTGQPIPVVHDLAEALALYGRTE